MSLLRPKDRDYITRGLFMLIVWIIVTPLLFAFLGGLIGGVIFSNSTGTALLGFMITIPLGIWLYTVYLNWYSKHG